MDATGGREDGAPGQPGAPQHSVLITDDLDEARDFCRQAYYNPLRVRPTGDTSTLAFCGDVVQLGPITVGEISYGSDVTLHTPDLETAYHVLAPMRGSLLTRHRGVAVTADAGRAAVFQPAGDVDLHWPGDCRLFSIKVDRAALERELEVALERPLGSPLPLGSGFRVGYGPGRTWLALVRLLHAEIAGTAGLLTRPAMARRWRDLVISGLALTVEIPDGPAGQPIASRPRTVKRALDAMHADPGRSFTAAELAVIAGVGIRVLQEAFRRHVGMPPLTYLRRLRLDGVHTELQHGDPREVSVSEVAYRWGFTHLGRFAGAYRARFGEQPSQTLRDHD